MSEIAPQPIEPPAHEHVESAPLRVPKQRIEGRSAILRTRDAAIHVLRGGPSTCVDVAAQLGELVFWCLIGRTDTRIDRGSHVATSAVSCNVLRYAHGHSVPEALSFARMLTSAPSFRCWRVAS